MNSNVHLIADLLHTVKAINCDSTGTLIMQSFITHFKVYSSLDDSRFSVNMVQNKGSL